MNPRLVIPVFRRRVTEHDRRTRTTTDRRQGPRVHSVNVVVGPDGMLGFECCVIGSRGAYTGVGMFGLSTDEWELVIERVNHVIYRDGYDVYEHMTDDELNERWPIIEKDADQ